MSRLLAMTRLLVITMITLALGTSFAGADDATPLHEQIDQLIGEREVGPIAGPADDATFLRRVSLDLIGRIPTPQEVEAFLADTSPDKRLKTIDALLAGDEFPRYMAVVFDLMMMERRGGKHVPNAEFRAYLQQAFRENRSYLEIAAEVLAADGTPEKNRAAAAFYLERDVEPHLLTRDVGRVFFGVDLQCAQCHNHPLIADYHQADYYGLNAFFVRASLFRPDNKKPALISELATGEADFKSVFTDREGMIRPLVPDGTELVEVTLKPDQQYQVAPAKNVRPIPTYSRVTQLAELIRQSPSSAFDRNIVNRLWAHMLGRGLVHPVDLHHSENPPTHPKVLQLMAERFAASGYDVKALLRVLAQTQVYQRSHLLPELEPSIAVARQEIAAATQSAEGLADQASEADLVVEQLIEQLDAVVAESKPVRDAEAKAQKDLTEALKVHDAAQVKVTARQKELGGLRAVADAVGVAVQKANIAVAALNGNTELAAALATLQKQATAIAAQVQKSQELLTAEQAGLESAQTALAPVTAVAEQAIAARSTAEEKIREHRQQVLVARAKVEQLRTQANLAARNAAYLQRLVAYGEARGNVVRLTGEISQTESELSTLDGEIVALADQMQVQQGILKAAQETASAQQNQLSRSRTALDDVRRTQFQLATSISGAESAARVLGDDQDVAQAVSLLQTALTKIETQVDANLGAYQVQERLFQTAQEAVAVASREFTTTQTVAAKAGERKAALASQLAERRQLHADAQAAVATTWQEVVDDSSRRLNAAGLTPLNPEQMAMSLLVATGQFDRQFAGQKAKLDKEKPLSPEAAADPALVAARQAEIAAATYQALDGTVGKFAKLYGAGAGQPQGEFFATAEQSLFVANGDDIRAWLQPGAGNLTDRLIKQTDPALIARDLYLSVFSRQPSEAETQDVRVYLDTRSDEKSAAVQELAWALLSSAEFRFRY